MKKIILITVFAFVLTSMYASTYYWIGGGTSTAPKLWNQASNWSTTSGGAGNGSVPGSNDIVVFDASANNVNPFVSIDGMTISIAQLKISQGASANNAVTFVGNSNSFSLSGDLTINRNATYYGQIVDAGNNMISVGGNIVSNATVGFTLVRIPTTTNTSTNPNAGKIALTGATPTIGSGITGNLVLGFQSLDISSTTNATFNTAVNASGGLQINGNLNIQTGGKLTMASPLILNSTLPSGTNPFNSPGTISGSGIIVAQNSTTFVIKVQGTLPTAYTMSSPQAVGTINFDPTVTTQANAISFSRANALTTIGSCNSNTFSVAGNLTLNAGIIDDGGNTLAFAYYPTISTTNTTAGNAIHRGTGRIRAQRNSTMMTLVTAGKTVSVNNLEIGSGSSTTKYMVGTGTNLIVNGSLTFSKVGGGIDATGSTLTFQNGSTPIVLGTGVTTPITTGSTTNLVFGTTGNKGGASVSLPQGAFSSSTINSLTINKDSVVALNGQITSVGTLNLSSGNIDLGNSDLTVTGSIVGGSSSSYVATTGTGKLIQSAAAGTAELFPVGALALNSYDPVSVTPTTASTFAVKVSASLSGSASTGIKYNPREWSISPTTASSTVVSLTSSTLLLPASSPVIGAYSNGAYVINSGVTISNGNTFTGTFSSFSPLVTGTYLLEYHVDPVNGNASANATGTLADPFKTIAQAQNMVWTKTASMTTDIVVYLHSGTYALASTLNFSASDGGANGFNVIYKAYNTDKPVISGGKAITGWTAVSGKGYWKANVATGYGYPFYMRNIFVNGKRAIQARSPYISPNLFNYEDPTSTYYRDGVFLKNSDIKNYSNVTDMRYFHCGIFKHIEIPVLNILQATTTESAIALQQPAFYAYTTNYTYQYQIARPIRLINAFEELDEPGEFYHNRSTGTVYYYPRPGEDMTTANVIAPTVETLVKVTGTTSSFVNNLRFEGIAFQYGNWTTWVTKEIGRSQADLYSDYRAIEGQVQLQYSNNITFKGCRFEHLLGSGIYLPDNNNNTTIQGNIFNDLTCAAVLVGKDMTCSAIVNNNTLIDNNVIRSIGADFYQASGIYANASNNLTITHNDVADVAYFGINQRYQDLTTNFVGNTQIKYNKVSNYATASRYGFGIGDEVAAYYFYDVQNSVISNNYGEYRGNKPIQGCFREDSGGLNNIFSNNVADCKNCLRSFSGWPNLATANLKFDSNYANVASEFLGTAGWTNTNFHLEANAPSTPWSAAAQAIIDSAGLEPAYKNLLAEFGPDVYDTTAVPVFNNSIIWSDDLVNYTKPTRYPLNKDINLFKFNNGHTSDWTMQHDSITLINTVKRRAIFTGALYGNEYARFRTLLNDKSNTRQEISFRASNYNGSGEVPRYYFSFSRTNIYLYRVNQDLTTQTLIGTGGSISAAVNYSSSLYTTGSTIDIYSNNESNGVHIILLIDGVKVIDCVDSSAGYITASGVLMFNSNAPGTIMLCSSPAVVNVTGVNLSANTKSMKPGDTFNLTATLSPSNVTYPEVVFSSSNPAVATVTVTGLVTAKTTGTARITVTTRDGNFTAFCDVNVTITTLNNVDEAGNLSAWVSRNGLGTYQLNIKGLKSDEPVDIHIVDLLGRVRMVQKSVVADKNLIQLPINWNENMSIGVVQLKYRSGESLSLKINSGTNR